MKRTHIVSGNILHDGKLYLPGDSITFGDEVSEDHIAELKRAGNLGGPEARAIQRKRIVQEDQLGVEGMNDKETEALWHSTTHANAQQLQEKERHERQLKGSAEEQRQANIDPHKGESLVTPLSPEQREQQTLERQTRDVNTDMSSTPVEDSLGSDDEEDEERQRLLAADQAADDDEVDEEAKAVAEESDEDEDDQQSASLRGKSSGGSLRNSRSSARNTSKAE